MKKESISRWALEPQFFHVTVFMKLGSIVRPHRHGNCSPQDSWVLWEVSIQWPAHSKHWEYLAAGFDEYRNIRIPWKIWGALRKINWEGYHFIISDQGQKFSSLLKRTTIHWNFFFFRKFSDYDILCKFFWPNFSVLILEHQCINKI